jgi:hypothetical protein
VYENRSYSAMQQSGRIWRTAFSVSEVAAGRTVVVEPNLPVPGEDPPDDAPG